MVATETLVPLAASFKLDGIATINRGPSENGQQSQTSSGKRNQSGLDLEKRISLSGRGRSFFLTSLFIELIEGSGSAPFRVNECKRLWLLKKGCSEAEVGGM